MRDFNPINKDNLNKPEIEQVEKEKHEYHLIGTYLRTRGLKLFFFNHFENKIDEVITLKGDTIHAVPQDGKLIAIDYNIEKAMIDPRFIFFEALNLKSAINRVKKYKNGKIELFNLRKPGNGINFW